MSSRLWAFFLLSLLPCQAADFVFGRRVYASQGRTFQQIWSLDSATGKIAALTNSQRRHIWPVCSSDRRRIWYLSGAFGDPAQKELWWFDPASRTEKLALRFPGDITQLLGGTGGQVFFLGYEGSQASLYRWDGKLTKVGAGTSAALSPDGRTLAVPGDKPADTVMLDAAGKRGRKLERCADALWTADARKVACTAGQTVRVIDLTTGLEAARAEFNQRPTPPTVEDVSPDGARLLVKTVGANHNSTSPQSDFWVLDTGRKKWTFVGPGQAARLAGSRVLMVTPRELGPVGGRSDWVAQVVLADPARHSQKELAGGGSYNTELCGCAPAARGK